MLKGTGPFNLPEIEEKVLASWKANAIFEKTLQKNKKKKTFKFYEGPPYANGKPGIHHVLARVFKDIILRYKSMQGYYVPRRAGWDTHGLPIELAAEKELGIKSKKDIEKFGVALFNSKAKESVMRHKKEFEDLTERIGYWLDLKNAYITYKNPYIESLWWIFSEIARRGYLIKSYKVVPYCPSCQTPLASHELGQPGVYKKVPDPSLYVKLKLVGRKNEYLLVWTTTPWTLPANVAVAADAKLTYTKYKVGKDFLWSYSTPPEMPGVRAEVVEKMSGKKLLGLAYEPLFADIAKKVRRDGYWTVVPGDFISTEEGTGFVHIAPAFGEDDLRLMQTVLKDFSWDTVPITIDDAAKVVVGLPGAGKFIKEADKDILADLEARGVLYSHGTIEHEYPFCWRCSAPLVYFARRSWFIEMSRLRKELVAANKNINWIPGFIKEGRFGEWVREAKDWAISRERYWGTPLPIWECGKCEHMLVAGSLADLDKHAYRKNEYILVRHTEAEANTKKIIASGPEKGAHISELTAAGRVAAEKLAKSLVKKKIDIVFASPYARTQAVAKTIAKETGAKVITDERLAEINDGIFNWRPVEELRKYFVEPMDQFHKAPPDAETLLDVKRRAVSFLKDIDAKYRGARICVVSHADVLWLLEAVMRGLTDEEAMTGIKFYTLGTARPTAPHNWPIDDLGNLDMHRPFADTVELACPKCDGIMKRVSGVADVWFDSGAMPFASAHYPFENKKLIDTGVEFPADYICEAIDQTRGWFYTLLAVSVLLGRKEPYKNVICLDLILDKYGQKMSKSKGNIADPWDVINKFGIDSVRWYFYTINRPEEPKRFDEADVKKTYGRFILMLYNSYVFYATYAKESATLGGKLPSHPLDRWILSRLSETNAQVTKLLDEYQIGDAAKRIEALVDDLSRWHIRRSRRRLQRPTSQKDYTEASATLRRVLEDIAKMSAPFTPFFSDALFKSLNPKKLSVHLEEFPWAGKKPDAKLLEGMEWVRKTAAIGLAKRASACIKVRQPLASLTVQAMKTKPSAELLAILQDEINVKAIIFDKKFEGDAELDIAITPELREEGLVREITRAVQELRQKAGLKPSDRIELYIEAEKHVNALTRHEKELKMDVGAKTVTFRRTDKFDAESESEMDGEKLWVAVRKI